VKDTGYGIAPEDQPHIFERFYRVTRHPAGAHSTGLGLAIARQIVREHGGEICVESEAGQGSTFTVLLPRKRDDD
jgi:two-component system sensor histidine kinase ResE